MGYITRYYGLYDPPWWVIEFILPKRRIQIVLVEFFSLFWKPL